MIPRFGSKQKVPPLVSLDGRLAQHQHHPTCPRKEDLEFGSLLGEGAFARVVHVRDVRYDEEYALKIVDKRLIQAKGRTSSVLAERSLLSSFSHPGIVSLRFSFQDEWCLYFVLEYVAGGELATQISRRGICSLEFAQFYAAEIVAILEYLRAMRVAHRDLKPENILMTLDGHLKLVDFDAAVIVPVEAECEGDAAAGGFQKQPRFAGTAYYLSPEVLLGTAKPWEAFALDMWALGCIVYFMLVGHLPFDGESEYLLFQNILAISYVFPPGFCNHEAQDLIGGLLEADPCKRLGTTKRKKGAAATGDLGITEVKGHPFFGGSLVAFDKLRRVSPPPRMKSRVPSATQLAGKESSSSIDFTSSAECTPEIGQGFLARSSTVITVELSPENLTNSEDENVVAMPQVKELSTPREPATSVNRHSHVKVTPGNRSPDTNSQLSLLSPARTTPRPPTPRNPRPYGIAMDWRAVVNVPFASWQLWLSELLRRKLLFKEEDVTICGSVVKRKIPCLKPKVLVLTTFPRLLVLDSKGLNLVQEIDLTKAESLITVKSSVEFVLTVPTNTYKCCDITLGAEEWQAKVLAARCKALISRLSMATLVSVLVTP